MSVAPIDIVPPVRRRGRVSRDEIEASTPTGRALRWLEARLMDWHRHLSSFGGCFERETLLDRELDGYIRAGLERGDATSWCQHCGPSWIEVRTDMVRYTERDPLRDAENADGGRHVDAMRPILARVSAFVERSCAALIGGSK